MILTASVMVSREIAELHKNNATQDSRAQQAALSAEMQVREELKMAMEQQKQQHEQEREALIMQVGSCLLLRGSIWSLVKPVSFMHFFICSGRSGEGLSSLTQSL